jgi:hypothetical protein
LRSPGTPAPNAADTWNGRLAPEVTVPDGRLLTWYYPFAAL